MMASHNTQKGIEAMRTYKAKTSNYNSVKTDCIIKYIQQYNNELSTLLADETATRNTDRTTLKSIAASLETAIKQLRERR
jgi:hypothetical protein